MLDVVHRIIDKLQEKFPPNRVVLLLSPVFLAASSAGTAWVAQHFPGLPPFDPIQLTAIAGAGAVMAFTAVYKWIDGWQKHVDRNPAAFRPKRKTSPR